MRLYRSLSPKSFLLKHLVKTHWDLQEEMWGVKFTFKPVEYHETSFRRQIGEAVEIMEGYM